MNIIHLIDDFLSELFPRFKESGNDLNVLREDLEKFYSFGSYKPVVSIEGQLVRIEVDVPAIMSQEADFRRAANLCEAGRFQDAKPIMTRLIEKNPTHSEYHRVLGQVYSEEGDQDAAIDTLIEALRWDPKNGYALLMMGNIFAKFKNDIETATIYFDQAVKANPEDNIAVNNIGATLLQQGRTGEAEKYFRKAHEIDPNYPNTHYALGLIAEMAGDYTKAFTHTIEAIRVNKKKDVLLQNSLKQAINAAMKAIENSNLEQLVRDYLHGLEFEADVKIELKQDADIPTAAKIEFAENYGRDHHVIRFKPGYPAVEHLIMHELVHLDFVLQARKEGENQLFVSTQSHKSRFIKSLEPALKRLSKMGIAEDSLARYATDLFEGMNRQVFNTPIDLFIEQKLYDDFPTLRPCPFLSLYQLMNENVKAVTDKKIVELTPKDILSKSRTFNLIYTLQFRDLYGLDMVEDLKAPPGDLKEAIRLYEEYLEYKDDRAPGEEYELVKHWAEDLM